MTCLICKRKVETNLGECNDCIEAMSIIDDGRDLNLKDIEGKTKTLTKYGSKTKLMFLIKKGWSLNGRK